MKRSIDSYTVREVDELADAAKKTANLLNYMYEYIQELQDKIEELEANQES